MYRTKFELSILIAFGIVRLVASKPGVTGGDVDKTKVAVSITQDVLDLTVKVDMYAPTGLLLNRVERSHPWTIERLLRMNNRLREKRRRENRQRDKLRRDKHRRDKLRRDKLRRDKLRRDKLRRDKHRRDHRRRHHYRFSHCVTHTWTIQIVTE